MHVKNSVGIILCSKNENNLEVLLVKKRCSYAYCDFIKGGTYFTTSKNFEKMTRDEMSDILKLDFKRMWDRYIPYNFNKDNYDKKYILFFERYIKKDSGKMLINLINSTHRKINLFWECPKGGRRINKTGTKEDSLLCAIREFEEETSIKQTSYTILNNVYRYISHISNKITYKTKYYVAYTNKLININNKFENIIKTNEIIDIGWFNIEKLHYLDLVGEAYNISNLIKPIFNLIKKEKFNKKNVIKNNIKIIIDDINSKC